MASPTPNQLGNRFTPQEQLAKFAKSALPHLLERVADVDPRVAGAAVRCLKQTELTEILKEIRFWRVFSAEDDGLILNMVMGNSFPKNAGKYYTPSFAIKELVFGQFCRCLDHQKVTFFVAY